MGTKKKFTPEELKHLQANPYTLRVTADSISYTLAFKEAFWALSLQGYTGTAAFRKLGYNCIGTFDVPDRRKIPETDIIMETRKGVALSYAPEGPVKIYAQIYLQAPAE